MKKPILLTIVFGLTISLGAQEPRPGTQLGAQLSSDGMATLLVHARAIEAGVKAQVFAYDYDDGDTPDILVFGAHVAYLLHPKRAGYEVGIGAELRNGVGTAEVEYDEYVRAGARIGLTQPIGNRASVSGLLYPVWIQTIESEDLGVAWNLEATIPKAAVAVTFFF